MRSEKRAFDTRVNRAAAAASQTAGKKGSVAATSRSKFNFFRLLAALWFILRYTDIYVRCLLHTNVRYSDPSCLLYCFSSMSHRIARYNVSVDWKWLKKCSCHEFFSVVCILFDKCVRARTHTRTRIRVILVIRSMRPSVDGIFGINAFLIIHKTSFFHLFFITWSENGWSWLVHSVWRKIIE